MLLSRSLLSDRVIVVVFDAEALAYEKATSKSRDEFKRKVRTLTGNYQEYFHLDRFMTNETVQVLFQVISHKILRLLAPFFMMAMLAASLISPSPYAALLFSAQMGFYALAFIGLAFPVFKSRVTSIPYMFCLMNLSALMAFFQYFLRQGKVAAGKSVLWDKTKEEDPKSGSLGFDIQRSGDVLLLGTLGHPQESFYMSKIKPALDYAGASAGLVLASPVMAAVALAVKMESSGPAIYKQERVGVDGKPFTIYKFRSMAVDAEKNTGAVWASKNDSRVTKVGRFIRKTHLDELPQLLNVLRGEMSLIGPRPERPDFVGYLKQNIEGYQRRTAIKPGITGLAQVLHKYDETLQDVRKKVRYDLEYIGGANFSTDLKIALLTMRKMVNRQTKIKKEIHCNFCNMPLDQ